MAAPSLESKPSAALEALAGPTAWKSLAGQTRVSAA
jgi:hypothetical protein